MNVVDKMLGDLLLCLKDFFFLHIYAFMSIITFVISDLTINFSRDFSVKWAKRAISTNRGFVS